MLILFIISLAENAAAAPAPSDKNADLALQFSDLSL
jgi:hypothetical protein